MKLTIKNRLYIGLVFLFLLIVLLWMMSYIFINRVTFASSVIIKDNYESLESAKNMTQYLDDILNIQTSCIFNSDYEFEKNLYKLKLDGFEKNLKAEENNITEVGEKELAQQLRLRYEYFINLFNSIIEKKSSDTTLPLSNIYQTESEKQYFSEMIPVYKELRTIITGIHNVNSQAIIRKNKQARLISERVFIYITIFGALSLLMSLYFIYKFPVYIIHPIKELTAGIKEIANRNYEQRLNFNSRDEFGEVANAFNVMAQRLNEYDHSNLAEALYVKKRIETIINNMQDAIIGLNEDKHILFVNTTACKIIGLKKKEMLGKYAPDVAAQNDLLHNILKDIDLDNNQETETKEFKPIKIFVDGKEAYFTKENLKVMVNKTGEKKNYFIGNVITLKNITKYKELDFAKTNFIATVSHELKTPIASIKMSLKLLEDERIGTLNEEQIQLISSLRQETERLTKITGELLDLTQVETGNIRLDFKPVNPRDMIDYVCNTLKYQAEQKNIEIRITNKELPVPKIIADMEKTAWVLVNLLTNAIRYSNDNGIINIDTKQENGFVHFSVQDFGKGIESKYKDRIFEKFFLIPGASHSGTGLGLAISKEFISEQNGRMWFESQYGKGSTFHFTLPVYKESLNS